MMTMSGLWCLLCDDVCRVHFEGPWGYVSWDIIPKCHPAAMLCVTSCFSSCDGVWVMVSPVRLVGHISFCNGADHGKFKCIMSFIRLSLLQSSG